MEPVFLPREHFDALIDALADQGYRVHGPTVRAGSVVFDEIESAEEMPRGLESVQEPGRYRLRANGSDRLFDFVNGHESLKRFTFAPKEKLWRFSADGTFTPSAGPERTAVIGARACDIAGMRVQDRTFLANPDSPHQDPYYASRREHLFVVAVNCTRCTDTCFCASQGTGPKARDGFDVALTELDGGFIVETGSTAGEAVAERLSVSAASDDVLHEGEQAVQACAGRQTRLIDNEGIYELLFNSLEHPRWDDVAERCLSCANCVMVCPTCFCHREADVASMDGSGSDHIRQWDACFTLEHGSVHGGYLRPQVRQRYRQWLTHKLGSWWEQFGVSGCVGCGRCITWCPTGIDLTEEVAAIRDGGTNTGLSAL